MRKQLHKSFILFTAICFLFTLGVSGQRKVEKLGRGVVAVNLGSGNVYVSWRLLVSDPEDVAFNLYRSIGGGAATKLNITPIAATTDFSDNSASTSANNEYFVKPVINGIEQSASKSFILPGSVAAKRYMPIPLQPLAHYSAQHIYPADLDGDGEYDYIVKRLPADPHNNVMVEAYKNDGTFMWRVDLGQNIEQGAATHNPFILAYDFDSDGKAEVLIRSSEGTSFTDGTTIGDVNGDGVSDYRTFPPVSDLGYMLLGDNCPEFLSMVDGMTGKELARTNWIDRGRKSDWNAKWGDTYGHRMSMQFIGVAYFDGIHPSIFGSRGPGELMDIAAWDYSNKQFTSRWTWSSRNNASIPSGYHWADFHNIRIADLDGDGKDEISFGVNAMDDNGLPLYYAKNDIGHGDRFVITDLDPERPGLECYAIQQTSSVLAVLYDVKTGERLKTWSSSAPFDVSRGDAADIDPRYKGAELWSYAHSSVLDCKGNPIPGATTFPHPALSIWWDGDLSRENLDAADGNGFNPVINKWNYAANNTARVLSLYNEGGAYSTKTPYAGRASLYGDILGDWREEVFCMNGDSTEIRIFSTWTPASTKLYCLMQNPEYRACIGPKGYLPSTEVDYYLGVGMTTPPTPPVLFAKSEWAGGLNGNSWDISSSNNWRHHNILGQYTEADTVMFDISGAGNTSVALNIPVNPGFLIVNSPINYSFAGTGSISGTTSLLKSGQGALTIATAANFSGRTKVEQGDLYVNSTLSQSTATIYKDAGIGGTGTITKAVNLEKGAIIIPGTKNTVGTLTFSADLTLPGKNSFLFDITDDATHTTKPSDKININGNLVLTDTNYLVINKLNGTVNPGTYPIISYSGSFTGNLSNIIISGLYGQKVTLSNSGNVISMTVLATRSPENIVWAGVDTKWDLLASPNWLSNGVSEVFVTGDTVVFDGTGSGQYNVNVTEGVSIGNMIVDASSNDYSFTGSGSIGGTGGLIKTGAGTLTISNSNIFTGKIAINGGILQINKVANAGNASPLGASTDTVPGSITLSNACLKFTGTGSSNTTDRGITLAGMDTIDISAASSAQLAFTSRIAGTGTLIKKGPGILMMQPTFKNTFTGGTVIKEGTISFGNDIANLTGLGTDTIRLDGGTLSMYNNSTSYTDATYKISVPDGATGSFNTDARCRIYGTLKGSGTLNVYLPGTIDRTIFFGDWSAFSGTINISGVASSYFRIANYNGYARSSINLNTNVTMYHGGAGNTGGDVVATTVQVGALSGQAGSTIKDENWTVGSKNTDAIFNGSITGASITKVGTGAWTLTGANTYTGGTVVNGGTLIINNTTGSGTGTGAVAVNNSGTLAGSGSVSGSVSIASGGTIAPGTASIGSLKLGANLTLNAGSYTTIKTNLTNNTQDTIRTTGSAVLNGTLKLQLLAGNIGVSNAFKIINASSYSGNFSAVYPPVPGIDMNWDLSTIPSDGTLRVLSAVKQNQTVTIDALATQTYGNADISVTTSASTGLPVTLSTSNTSIATILEGKVHITGAGTCNIIATQEGDYTYNPVSASISFVVVKADQTIAFTVPTGKKCGDAAFDLTATGGASGNAVTYISSNTDIAAISGKTVNLVGSGTITITASQAGNNNFNAAADIQQTLTVDKGSQTISFSALPSKKITDAMFNLKATSSAGLPISYTSSNTSVATIIGATVTIVGIGTSNITASQAGNSNYNAAADVQQMLTVNKASQTISFNDLPSKKADDATFSLTAVSSSGLPVSYSSSNTTVANINGSTVTIVGVGTTNIVASQPGNSNYNAAADVTKTLTVDKASQTISFSDLPSKKLGDAPFSLTATSSSGLPVSYTSSNTSVAVINGSMVTIVGAGTTNFIASQAGNNSYNAALDVTKTLNVTTTGVGSLIGQNIIIAPNPVKENLTLTFGHLDTKSTIGIYSMGGIQLYSQKAVDKITIIPMGQFQPGLYIIKVTSQEGLVIKQIVKQ